MAGWMQLMLAMLGLAEMVRRFVFGSEPVSGLMMGMGLVALIANATCLVLIGGLVVLSQPLEHFPLPTPSIREPGESAHVGSGH